MWTPSQVNLKFRLNFWNYQPSCLPSSPRWARVTRYKAVRPLRPWSLVWPYVLPVPDCLRVAAPSLSLLGWSPASSLPPHSTPCRYNNPAPWCSQSHPRTPCWPGVRGNITTPASATYPSPAQSAALATLSTPVPISTFDQSLSKRVHWGR